MKHSDKIKKLILDKGVELWHQDPKLVTARSVANALDMTHGTIIYQFGNIGIYNAVAEYAVKIGDSAIITQLIGRSHYAVAKLSSSQKNKYMRKCAEICVDVQ